mgnify:CR=1 FL=1
MKQFPRLLLAAFLAGSVLATPQQILAQTFDELWQQAETAQQEGNYGQMESILRQATGLYPRLAVGYYGLGIALAAQNKPNEALDAFCRAFQLNYNNADLFVGLGVAFQDLGYYNDALNAFDRAIELDPTNAIAYNDLGVVLQELGRQQAAIEAYQRAIALDPEWPVPQNNLDMLTGNSETDDTMAREN